jgi:hypothetical protein
VTDATALRDNITSNSWVAEGLSAGAGMSALDATIRPIDALATAGLGWLTSHVQPLQDVADRMAGKASAIQVFADAWQRVSDSVDQVHQRIAQAVPADTTQWRGTSADSYRTRANEITTALQGVTALSTATGSAARTMGQAAGSARQGVGDLLNDLVQRLISYVSQATAAEGGVTSNVMSQATTMINSYQAPIADMEQKLKQTISNAERYLTGQVQVAGPGAVSAVLGTWQSLQEQLAGKEGDGGVTRVQQIIQLPPVGLPPDARPLSKARLNEIAQNPIFFGKLGLNVTVGDYAEDAARQAMGFQQSNERRFYPYADSSNPLESRKSVIPDAVTDREVVDVTVDPRTGIPTSAETHTLRDGVMVEIKATSGPITLSDPRDQMQKYVDYLAKSHNDALRTDPNSPSPWLVYAATTETTIDPRALAYAESQGVAVWRAQLYESGSATDPFISVGAPLPQNSVAQQDLNNQLAPPLQVRPAPLFNSPYDQLLRRNMLRNEQN